MSMVPPPNDPFISMLDALDYFYNFPHPTHRLAVSLVGITLPADIVQAMQLEGNLTIEQLMRQLAARMAEPSPYVEPITPVERFLRGNPPQLVEIMVEDMVVRRENNRLFIGLVVPAAAILRAMDIISERRTNANFLAEIWTILEQEPQAYTFFRNMMLFLGMIFRVDEVESLALINLLGTRTL